MGEIALEYRVPSDDLQPFVTLFYQFRVDAPVFEDTERAANAQLRFRLSPGAGGYGFHGKTPTDVPDCHVIGPTNVAMQVRAAGPLEVVGLGLHPAGWAAMLELEASELLNRVVDAEVLFGALAGQALAALRAEPELEARFAILSEFVRSAVARGRSRGLDFARQIDAWLASSASPDLAVLLADTGLSRRQIERRCNALYGAPPKMLARKYRALRAAVALSGGTATIDDLIGDGFYDQSHLIRELKQFTGRTPRQLVAQSSALSALTIAQRHALDGKVHPIISRT